MKIIFFGSAHFAVPALESLIKEKHKILCVVTQPDKKKGRYLHLGVTDIKALALEAGLRVFQPENINTPKSVEFLNSLNADLFVTRLTFAKIPRSCSYKLGNNKRGEGYGSYDNAGYQEDGLRPGNFTEGD